MVIIIWNNSISSSSSSRALSRLIAACCNYVVIAGRNDVTLCKVRAGERNKIVARVAERRRCEETEQFSLKYQ